MYGDRIKPTKDRKVWTYKNQHNTYGLLEGLPESGGTCPGATTGPGGCQFVRPNMKTPICYVSRSRPGVHQILRHNTELLVTSNPSEDRQVELMCMEVERFHTALVRRNQRTGENLDPYYRWHWAGDIPNVQYAHAMRRTMETWHQVSFWGYTRTLEAVPVLDSLPNLKLYLSMDPQNHEEVRRVFNDRTRSKRCNLAIAYMGEEQRNNKLLKDIRTTACPVDTGAMDLEGGCNACRLCLRGYHIFFNTDLSNRKKRELKRKAQLVARGLQE